MCLLVALMAGALCTATPSFGQIFATPDARTSSHAAISSRRAKTFVRGRLIAPAGSTGGATAFAAARTQHLRLEASPRAASLTAAWTPVGPVQVQSSSYGLITGRVTALAVDPSDLSGNTVYLGASGGGVWKSTNAAATTASVRFTPLTDTLPVFSPGAGNGAIPSLSIGAITVQPGGTGVIIAGTGDPNDATDSYYGSGMLRSADNGLTWSLISYAADYGGTHSFTGQGFAGFAWSTTSPQLVVAAVSSAAESDIVADDAYPSVRGLYFSNDGGTSWTLATIQDGGAILQAPSTNFNTFRGNAATAVVWNPVRKRFYAAVRFHGYYESTDGMSWTRLANQPGSGLTTTNCPSRPGTYGSPGCPIFRGAVASQSTSGDLFALTVDASNVDQGLWQDACSLVGSVCASSSVIWSNRLDSTIMETFGNLPEGDYNLALAAVPASTSLSANDTLLFAATADLYRCSLAGGCVLRNTTNTSNGCAAPAGVAPAQHAIGWQANVSNPATPLVYLGNDGGLWRSADGVAETGSVCSSTDATHFDNLNGALGSLAEIVSLSSHPSDSTILLAALGANGTAASTSSAQATNQSAWTQVSSAESGTVAIDQGSGNIWMAQSGAGVALHTCTSGSTCKAQDFVGPASVGATQVSSDASLIDPPALLDPALNTNVILGTCRIWRGPTSASSAWSSANAISPFLSGPVATSCNGTDATIRSLAAGGKLQRTNASQTSGSSVLYAGLSGTASGGNAAGGGIFGTSSANSANSSTAWTNLGVNGVTNDSAGFNPGKFDISAIAADPNDTTGRTVYATIQGFGVPHLYRSTDAGVTWTNISANLPNAPANAVAVDPNDARIIYVASDTGVYVTFDVSTCVASSGSTANCWNSFGTSLPNAPVTSLVATSAISAAGSLAQGVLRAGTYGRGIWQQPLLSAGSAGAPIATFSPASLTFGAQLVGSASAAATATLTNTGSAALLISSLVASSGFLETDTCAGTTLPLGASCSIAVQFAPISDGPATGTIQVLANVTGGAAILPLTGTGVGIASIVLSPATLTFASTPVGSSAASQTVTVTNSGTAAAALSAPATSQDYGISSTTCGSTLAVGAACTIAVNYTPTTTGPNAGLLTVSDSAASHTVLLNASATGNTVISLNPTSFVFPGTLVGGVSFQFLNITNGGTAAATITNPVFSSAEFSEIYGSSCLALIPANSSCTIIIGFRPASATVLPATLSITVAGNPYTVPLSASQLYTQFNASLTPGSLTFPPTRINAVSASQVVTLNVIDYVDLRNATTQVVGDYGVTNNTCTVPALYGGMSCTFTVVFDPTAAGDRPGQLIFNASGLSLEVFLDGTGIGNATVGVTPSALSFPATTVGALSTPQSITVSNTGTIASSLGGPVVTGDFLATTSNCTSTIAAGASCAASVIFAPTSTGTRTGSATFTNASGIQTVSLSGNGVGLSAIAVAPTSLLFPATPLRAASAAQTITVTNSGSAAGTLSTPQLTGDFALSASTCGTSLAMGSSCTLSVTFTPTVAGARSGALTFNDGSTSHVVPLSGSGTAGVLSPSANAITFPSTTVNSSSPTQSFVISNTGTGALTISSTAITGDFTGSTGCAGVTLAAGNSCTIALTFKPTAVGTRTGSITLTSDSGGTPNSTQIVALSGNGVGLPAVAVTPASLVFAATALRSTSAAQTVTVTNSGSAAGTLTAPQLTGDFALSASTCGTSLAAGASCTLSVTFTPTVTGARGGTLTLADGSTPHVVALSGTGTTGVLSTSATAIAFADTQMNASSPIQTLTIVNTGASSLTISSTALTGDFNGNAGCTGVTLAAGNGCTVALTFKPTVAGARTGAITLTSDSGGTPNSTQTVLLSGNGVGLPGIAVTPTSLVFAATALRSTSLAQTITVSNSGSVAGTLSTPQLTSDFALSASTCSTSLAVGASCMLSVTFTPTVTGQRSGALTISDGSTAHVAALSGTGIAGMLYPSASAMAFPDTALNASSPTQSLTVTNTGIGTLTISSTAVTGDFTGNSGCAGAVLPSGKTCIILLTFTPTATGARSGSLTLSSDSGGTPNGMQAVALSGNGLGMPGVTLSPASQVFASTPIHNTSAAQTILVTNTGTAAGTLSAPLLTGDFALSGSTCSTSLGVNASCALAVTFTPSVAGMRGGSLTLSDGSASHVVALSGAGVSGTLSTPASAIAFPDTALNATSPSQSLTITNTGTGTLTISSTAVTGDFAANGGCSGAVLTAGKTCTLTVTFTPTAVGARSGTLTLTSDTGGTAGTPTTVALSGNGKGSFYIVLLPTSANFGNQLVGTTSAVTNITISNTGTVSGSLSSESVSGDFQLKANTCGTTLAPQTGCTVSVVFTPSVAGVRNGLLTVTDDAGTQTATLTGTGTAGATDTLAPTSLTFAAQQVNTASAAQQVTLTNTGDVPLTLVSTRILAGDFTVVNGCGPTLAARSTCAITIAFVPKSIGAATGTLQITDVQRIQTVALSGSSIAGPGVSLTPASLTFAATGVGVASAGQALTLTNNGGVALQLSAVTVTGDFGIVSGTSTCSPTVALASGSSCSFQVAFVPSAAGARSGTVTATSNAATQTAQLSGTGVDFALVANGPTSLTIATGGSAVFPLLLRPAAFSSDPVTYTCTGAPANSRCKVVSQYTDLSAISTVAVTVLTGTTASSRIGGLALLLPMLGLPFWGLPLWARSRRIQRAMVLVVGALAVLGMSSCGAGRAVAIAGTGTGGGGSGTSPVTPSGSYTITVSATAAGVTHSLPVTLIVQ